MGRFDGDTVSVSETDPSVLMPVHLDSSVEIDSTNKNGGNVHAEIKRGFNAFLDMEKGEIIDPSVIR